MVIVVSFKRISFFPAKFLELLKLDSLFFQRLKFKITRKINGLLCSFVNCRLVTFYRWNTILSHIFSHFNKFRLVDSSDKRCKYLSGLYFSTHKLESIKLWFVTMSGIVGVWIIRSPTWKKVILTFFIQN